MNYSPYAPGSRLSSNHPGVNMRKFAVGRVYAVYTHCRRSIITQCVFIFTRTLVCVNHILKAEEKLFIYRVLSHS